MPCFFKKPRISQRLAQLQINNSYKLYQEMLTRFSSEELHAMSENEILDLINEIWNERIEITRWKEIKRLNAKKLLNKEIEMLYG